MKYKTQIVQENNSYVGYVMTNNEVVYTTNLHPDPIIVTREITRFISSNSPNTPDIPPKPVMRSTAQVNLAAKAFPVKYQAADKPVLPPQETSSVPTSTPIALPQRKCCGRG